jgi:cytoskeletal protein RodZ
LKLYAEYLGLDSHSVVEAYLQSQGGLRRQGLHMETEKAIRAHKRPELQLPLRSVALVVLALTVVVFLAVLGKSWSLHRASSPAQPAPTTQAAIAQPAVPKADFDAYYQPKTKPAPEILESIQSK